MKYIIKNARLIPELTENFEEQNADVLIEDGIISKIRPCGYDFGNIEQIDANGMTLMPGLIDLHMHLYFFTSDFNKLSVESDSEANVVLNSLKYAKEFLRQGFTTIRDCGNYNYSGILIRELINQKLAIGPNIVTAGKCLSPTALGNETFKGLYEEVNSCEEIVKACRYEGTRGVDFLKYMVTGAVANAKGNPGALITSQKELSTVQEVAESMGLYVAGHCHGKDGIMLCSQVGIRTIEHASDIDSECVETILKNGNKTAIVPTLDPIALMNTGMLNQDAAEKIQRMNNSENAVEVHKMVQASRSGILTGWGTDVSMDFFSENPGCEFMLRSNRGYTNIEILKQATINSAKIIGREHEIGTIQEGKKADLIIIDGNPDKDISCMSKFPCAVFKSGERYF